MKETRLSDWPKLLRIAHSLIDQVNEPLHYKIIDNWALGGGTAMMVQIDHRESHDIDIFLDDAEALSFLDPGKRDFDFEVMPHAYDGDGARFQKFSFAAGEIDFICAARKTSFPLIKYEHEGLVTYLESVPEIIAKKIVYRGASITARDIFDVAAALEGHLDNVTTALRGHRSAVEATIEAMDRLNPEFVSSVISNLMIRDGFQEVAARALRTTLNFLKKI